MVRSFEWRQSKTGQLLRRLTFVGLLAPVLLFAAAAWNDRVATLAHAEGDGVKMVALVREQALNLFTGHETILDMIVDRLKGRDWSAIGDLTDLLHQLEFIDRGLDDVSEILVVDATGTLQATTAHAHVNRITVNQPCFLALSRNEVKSCISQSHVDRGSGQFVFSLSRRLDKDGVFNGVAQVGISADYLAGLWASATQNPSDIVVLFTSDGMVLAHSPVPLPAKLNPPGLGESLLRQIGPGAPRIVQGPLSPGGADRISIYEKVADNQVYICLSLDKNAILAVWYSHLAIYGFVAAMATAGIMLALGIASRRARSLDETLSQLTVSRADLAQVNAGLEARIAETLAASEAAHEQLAQGQKIQALGQLAGGIAHDFNNILQTVSGAATMMERRSEDPERIKRLARLTLEVVARGASITQRLLSFARRGKLSAEPIVTTSLMDGVGEVLAHTLGSSIIVRAFTQPGTSMIMADRGQLETALVNLGINARDAMPEGGTLTLSAREERVANDGAHPAGLQQGDYVRIVVTDTGTGMDAATLARVTEPFFTTKPAGVGTGLGLSIVRGFADQSGGGLLIESAPGSGTWVTLWLPQAADADAAPPDLEPTRQARPVGQSTGCVLLVDDDDLVRETLAAQLEDLGFTTLEASSGHDAIAIVEAHEGVDALVCDLAMPDLNGIQTIRAVRHRRPELPCFLLTGYIGEQTALSRSDTFTLLRKPMSGGALADHIEAVLSV